MPGDVQRLFGNFLVERADPAASVAQRGGGDEEIFHHRCAVLEAVERSAPFAVSGGGAFGLGTDDKNHRGLDQEGLIECGLGETLLGGPIRDYVNEPRLAIARGRGLLHGFEETFYISLPKRLGQKMTAGSTAKY
jgi:hypothetical protein